jgi:branched-chain amino acid transport system substrate-binding protein
LSSSSQALLTRRAFLKASVALTGASVLTLLNGCSPSFKALQESRAFQAPVRVGLLLPSQYPKLAAHVLDGFRTYATTAAVRQIEMVVQEVGLGPYDAYRGAASLLDQQQPDLLFALINPALTSSFYELLEERQTSLLIADLGANVPDLSKTSPYVNLHSLGLWQAHFALGSRLGAQGMRRAVLVSSFYDSGYDGVYAFRHGFERAGGEVVASLVSHRPIDPNEHLAAMMDEIRALNPDLVYLVASGRDAQEFTQAFFAASLAERIPLASASYHLGAQPVAGLADFLARFEAETGRPADLFSLLGYESALLIDAALVEAGGSLQRKSDFQVAFRKLRVGGPRGELAFDELSASMQGPLYVGSIKQQSSGLYYDLQTALDLPIGASGLVSQLNASVRSGWSNPYLFG